MTTPARLERLREAWREAWPRAIACWSRYTRLSEPRWCLTEEDEQREGLTGSFAMIRLTDHAVVISLRQVAEQNLERFATEILAHEIGHHVYVPGDLTDNARLLARCRRGLSDLKAHAPMVANLYADLLLNDRLQRTERLDMAGVYAALKNGLDESPDAPPPGELWELYMRTYERLWGLRSGTLISPDLPGQTDLDADLAARLVRHYRADWLGGASRFALLCHDYLKRDIENAEAEGRTLPWLDAIGAGLGDAVPDGLVEMDADELGELLHPGDDPALNGFSEEVFSDAEHPGSGGGVATTGGIKNQYRDPLDFVELMSAMGVSISTDDLLIRYYRELARPHMIPFPMKQVSVSKDPLPEGLEQWDLGSPLTAVDWLESVIKSPVVIPGVTTVERTFGQTTGSDPSFEPPDLYLGVDCSGSMTNPRMRVSYPVIAGAVIVLSALRARAQAMVCLSGEPGRFSQTDGFSDSERENMKILTGYLGTGYAYGIERLRDTFLSTEEPRERPAHLLIVTDSDLFYMIKSIKDGWEVMERSLVAARGGGSIVLDMSGPSSYAEEIARLEAMGWTIYFVRTGDDLVTFARAFARQHYDPDARAARPSSKVT